MIPCDFKISPFVAPLLHSYYYCFLLAESHKYYELVVVELWWGIRFADSDWHITWFVISFFNNGWTAGKMRTRRKGSWVVKIVLETSHALCSHIFLLPFQTAQCKPPQSASQYQSLYYGYQQQHSYEQNDEANGEEYGVVRGGGG